MPRIRSPGIASSEILPAGSEGPGAGDALNIRTIRMEDVDTEMFKQREGVKMPVLSPRQRT